MGFSVRHYIGINAYAPYATDRLANLLQYTNQSQHYRQFSLGYYYLAIRGDAKSAVPHFAAAANQAPAEDQDPQNLHNRYREFLGNALVATGRCDQAVAVLRTAFQIQPTLQGQNDVLAYQSFMSALLGLAEEYRQQGRESEATSLWEDVARRCQPMLERAPEAAWYHFQGRALFSPGKLENAVAAYRKSIALESDPGERYRTCLNLAKGFYVAGDAAGAINALEEAARASPEQGEELERLLKQPYSSRPSD